MEQEGLTIPEWRILASLYGKVSRNLVDLCARTFVDPSAIMSVLSQMNEQNLCALSGEGSAMVITGTEGGMKRVAHLFNVAKNQENEILENMNEQERLLLLKNLEDIISNTNI